MVVRDTVLLAADSLHGLKYERNQFKVYSDKWKEFMHQYFRQYNLTDNVKSAKYCSIQESIMDMCKNLYMSPLCSEYLDGACKVYGRLQTLKHRSLSSMCGCRVKPDKLFLKYTKMANCDLLCNSVDTVQRIDMDTGKEDRCMADVCVINNMSINLSQSGVMGDQLCGHCGKDRCMCIISGVNVENVMGQTELTPVFNQYCSGNLVCIKQGVSGHPDQVSNCKENLKRACENADTRYIAHPVYYVLVSGFIVLFISIAVALVCTLSKSSR